LDDEDYRALISILSEELRTVGAADIADERHYVTEDAETGELRLLIPQLRLIEMLEALDRFLAIQDGATYRAAISSISQSVDGAAPERATVLLTTDGLPREVDLSKAPELDFIRRDLRSLIGSLLDSDRRPGGEFVK